MGDAFESLTEASQNPQASLDADAQSIEPRYVVILRAAFAMAVLWGGRSAKFLARSSAIAWARLMPLLKKAIPSITARAEVLKNLAMPLVAKLLQRGGRLRASKAQPTKLRRQHSRQSLTTQSRVPPAASRIPAAVKSKAFFFALAAAAVIGFGTGVWALVGLITSGEQAPSQVESHAQDNVGVPSKGSFDLWGGTALAQGNVAEAPEAEIDVVSAQVPEVVTPAVAGAPAPVPAPVADQGATAEMAVLPGTGSSGLQTQGFYLAVDGEVTGYDYYPLKDPAGLVVNVKGALPVKEGLQPIKGAGIKQIKAVARESGTRFIIYFEGKTVPDFQVLPSGSSLEVRLDT